MKFYQSGSFPTILSLLRSLFGYGVVSYVDRHGERQGLTHLNMVLDYLQILYMMPMQRLPGLCIYAKWPSGKTTFSKLLQQILPNQSEEVSESELIWRNDLDKKRVIICDEYSGENEDVIEIIKMMSTVAGEVDHKFILLSNSESAFSFVSKESTLFWVVNAIPCSVNVSFDFNQIKQEIPAFLHYLSLRNCQSIECSGRWFHPTLITTRSIHNQH